MNTTQLLDMMYTDNPLEFETSTFIARLRDDVITGETDLFTRLVRAACFAGSQANAVIAGHQAAIRRLFPDTPSTAITAFCVSEAKGPHPKHIHTQLQQDNGAATITGQKMWGTMAPPADRLYVAASIGTKDGQNQLRMVGIETGQDSIEQIPLPPERQAGDVPICDLKFTATKVATVLDADAYSAYIKPFRLIEDVFSTVAMQISLYRLGPNVGLTHAQREDLLGLIVQGHAVAETDMDSPAALLLITAYLRASQAHWQEMTTAPLEAVATSWQFDRPILTVAARARAQRRANAWSALGEALPDDASDG